MAVRLTALQEQTVNVADTRGKELILLLYSEVIFFVKIIPFLFLK